MRITKVIALAALLLGLTVRAADVTVFAAASLTDSLKEIGAAYQTKTGDKISFNFAASSLLQRQIEEGAPADVFFSADEAKMDALEKKGLIEKDTRKSRLSNLLVIIVPIDSSTTIQLPQDLTADGVKHIAVGDPKAVPAGIYAKEYLEKIHLWKKLAQKIVPMENVRAALGVVESGDAEAGIVYKTDAAISKKVRVVYTAPREDGPKISYSMAMMKDAKEPKAARDFLNYLDSDDAGKVFEKYGFAVSGHAP